MSQIISKLDNAEEEKSALEKETEKLDAAANELQEKREQLELRKLSNAKNLRKFGEKKKKLEKYLDKVTSEHQITKEQLERDIDELKIYIDSNNVEVLKVEKSLDWKNEWKHSETYLCKCLGFYPYDVTSILKKKNNSNDEEDDG